MAKIGHPVSERERQRIRQLHGEGLSRNAIARETGRSVGTITNIARQLGLTFDRAMTATAVAAHVADMRTWRQAKLIELAGKLDAEIRRWDSPTRVYNIGGRENVYTEHTLAEPPAETRLTMARTIGHLLDQHLKLVTFDAAKDEHGVSDVEAWLDTLTAGAGH